MEVTVTFKATSAAKLAGALWQLQACQIIYPGEPEHWDDRMVRRSCNPSPWAKNYTVKQTCINIERAYLFLT